MTKWNKFFLITVFVSFSLTTFAQDDEPLSAKGLLVSSTTSTMSPLISVSSPFLTTSLTVLAAMMAARSDGDDLKDEFRDILRRYQDHHDIKTTVNDLGTFTQNL